jgi:hypothetical protein
LIITPFDQISTGIASKIRAPQLKGGGNGVPPPDSWEVLRRPTFVASWRDGAP